tara:strand:- start:1097 stop:1618 length:522 start_codon:yes stop_codon:yes gene_type:complete
MKTLFTIGDSFTYGDELSDPRNAWPYLLAETLGYRVDNLARNGASNDYIMQTTVEYLETKTPDLVIIGWTTEDRIDIGGKTATVNHDPIVFKRWNSDWASKKLETQIITMDKYILKDIPHYHCATWIDGFYFFNIENYLGRFVDWAYGTEHGPGGHPLREGHERIAQEIARHI